MEKRRIKYFALKNPTKEQYEEIKSLAGENLSSYHFELNGGNLASCKMMIFGSNQKISPYNRIDVCTIRNEPINTQCYYEFVPFDIFFNEAIKRMTCVSNKELKEKLARMSNEEFLTELEYII